MPLKEQNELHAFLISFIIQNHSQSLLCASLFIDCICKKLRLISLIKFHNFLKSPTAILCARTETHSLNTTPFVYQLS